MKSSNPFIGRSLDI